MKTDVCIIGGGLAGLTSGIYLQQKGINTVILSKGAPGLSFSSGNIDVYRGHLWKEKIIEMISESHPYKKIGQKKLNEALRFFQNMYGEDLFENKRDSLVLTPFGKVLEDVDFIQESMRLVKKSYKKAGVLQLKGYGDFPYTIFRDTLMESSYFEDIEIVPMDIKIPYRFFLIRTKNLSDFISQKDMWRRFLEEVEKVKDLYDILFIPALLPSDSRYADYWNEIQKISDGKLREIPTSPPSVPGARMYQRLLSIYHQLGGKYEKNRTVKGYTELNGSIKDIHLSGSRDKVDAKYFLLTTGTFFTGGLISRIHYVEEPVFQADVDFIHDTAQWSDSEFYRYSKHKFLSFGVKTDQKFHAIKKNEIIPNLYVAGAILSGFNPLSEKSAGGVSIATSYSVALDIEENL